MSTKNSKSIFFKILVVLGLVIIIIQLNITNVYIAGMFKLAKSSVEDEDDSSDNIFEHYGIGTDYEEGQINNADISKLDDYDTNFKSDEDLVAFLKDFGIRNGIARFDISEKTQKFLEEQADFFPYDDKNDIPERLMEERLYHDQLEMNIQKYQDSFFRIWSAVALQVKVLELSSGEKITVILAEEEASTIGEVYLIVYQGEVEDLKKATYFSVVGVPLDLVSYQTLENTKELAVVVMARQIDMGYLSTIE